MQCDYKNEEIWLNLLNTNFLRFEHVASHEFHVKFITNCICQILLKPVLNVMLFENHVK